MRNVVLFCVAMVVVTMVTVATVTFPIVTAPHTTRVGQLHGLLCEQIVQLAPVHVEGLETVVLCHFVSSAHIRYLVFEGDQVPSDDILIRRVQVEVNRTIPEI